MKKREIINLPLSWLGNNYGNRGHAFYPLRSVRDKKFSVTKHYFSQGMNIFQILIRISFAFEITYWNLISHIFRPILAYHNIQSGLNKLLNPVLQIVALKSEDECLMSSLRKKISRIFFTFVWVFRKLVQLFWLYRSRSFNYDFDTLFFQC